MSDDVINPFVFPFADVTMSHSYDIGMPNFLGKHYSFGSSTRTRSVRKGSQIVWRRRRKLFLRRKRISLFSEREPNKEGKHSVWQKDEKFPLWEFWVYSFFGKKRIFFLKKKLFFWNIFFLPFREVVKGKGVSARFHTLVSNPLRKEFPFAQQIVNANLWNSKTCFPRKKVKKERKSDIWERFFKKKNGNCSKNGNLIAFWETYWISILGILFFPSLVTTQ